MQPAHLETQCTRVVLSAQHMSHTHASITTAAHHCDDTCLLQQQQLTDSVDVNGVEVDPTAIATGTSHFARLNFVSLTRRSISGSDTSTTRRPPRSITHIAQYTRISCAGYLTCVATVTAGERCNDGDSTSPSDSESSAVLPVSATARSHRHPLATHLSELRQLSEVVMLVRTCARMMRRRGMRTSIRRIALATHLDSDRRRFTSILLDTTHHHHVRLG